MPTAVRVAERCAAHPSRPAADHCPRCRRPRCAADRSSYGDRGCARCPAPPPPAPGRLEALVRAGLAGLAVAFVGGWIATQYVGVHVMSLIVPAAVGLAVGAAATGAARAGADRPLRRLATATAVGTALLGVGLGFRLVPHGGFSPIDSVGLVAAPYGCTVAGVAVWVLLFAPPPRSDSERQLKEREPARTP